MTIETGSSSEPTGYKEFIADLKQRVRTTQFRAVRAANTEVLRLYWSVGRDILDRQKDEGWGAKVVDQISADLRREFPDQRGWTRRNLMYMKALASTWPMVDEFVPQAVAQTPWGHVRVLLDKLTTRQDREWYAAKTVENGWSRASLEFEIKMDLKSRLGSAPSRISGPARSSAVRNCEDVPASRRTTPPARPAARTVTGWWSASPPNSRVAPSSRSAWVSGAIGRRRICAEESNA